MSWYSLFANGIFSPQAVTAGRLPAPNQLYTIRYSAALIRSFVCFNILGEAATRAVLVRVTSLKTS